MESSSPNAPSSSTSSTIYFDRSVCLFILYLLLLLIGLAFLTSSSPSYSSFFLSRRWRWLLNFSSEEVKRTSTSIGGTHSLKMDHFKRGGTGRGGESNSNTNNSNSFGNSYQGNSSSNSRSSAAGGGSGGGGGGSASSGGNDKDLAVIINSAKQLIKQGNTNEAFAVLLHAIKLTRGEDAILEVLDSVKQRHEIDMLSSDLDSVQMDEVFETMRELTRKDTLLKEQGNEGILTEAFEDGSSIVCKNCGGLIARKRWSDHVMYWCSASSDLLDNDDDDNDSDYGSRAAKSNMSLEDI